MRRASPSAVAQPLARWGRCQCLSLPPARRMPPRSAGRASLGARPLPPPSARLASNPNESSVHPRSAAWRRVGARGRVWGDPSPAPHARGLRASGFPARAPQERAAPSGSRIPPRCGITSPLPAGRPRAASVLVRSLRAAGSQRQERGRRSAGSPDGLRGTRGPRLRLVTLGMSLPPAHLRFPKWRPESPPRGEHRVDKGKDRSARAPLGLRTFKEGHTAGG